MDTRTELEFNVMRAELRLLRAQVGLLASELNKTFTQIGTISASIISGKTEFRDHLDELVSLGESMELIIDDLAPKAEVGDD